MTLFLTSTPCDRKGLIMDKPLWEVFDKLVNMVRQDHKERNALVGTGHDFSHALMVAQYCPQIANEPWATLGWVAAICHNTDRLFCEFDDTPVVRKIWQYLALTNIAPVEKELIVEAVLKHSCRPSPEDSELTVILKDADKLANIGYLLPVRSAQFHPNLPPINLVHLFEYPLGNNYRNPGSILRDVESSLEWEQPGWFRTPKAIQLAKPLFEQLRQFRDGVLKQYKDLGLVPYPFPQDFES